MSACLCSSCTSTPAPTYTEAHRFECELRHLANMPAREDRGRYLRLVAISRGSEASGALLTGLKRIHRQRLAA